MSNQSDPRHVLIRRDPLYLYIRPEIPELTALLSVHELTYQAVDGLRRQESLLRVVEGDDGETTCRTLSGFEYIVKDWLKRNGVRWVRAMGRNNPREIGKPQLGRLEQWNRPIDTGFLDFLRRSRRGIIRYSGRVQRDWLITQATLAYRKSKIMVTASRRHEVRALARQIHPYYSGVKPYLVNDFRGSRRLVVTTPAKAHAGVIEIEKRDFYFAFDPLELFQERSLSNPLEPLDQAKKARVFGFLPLERELNRRERTLLMGVFGTDELVLYQHGSVARKIEVAAVPANSRTRDLSVRNDAMSVRKQAIWRNETRHKLVAALARAVHRTSEVQLVKNFPRLTGLQLASRTGDVVVLVDNVEQATEMGKHLKEAKLVLDRIFWGSGLDLAVSQRIHEYETRPKTDFSLLIATMAGLWRVPRIGVLIRADSGRGLPPLTGEQLSTEEESAAPMLIVDIQDRYPPVIRTWWHARQMAYDAAGWGHPGDRDLSPLVRFLKVTTGGRP